MNASLAEKKGKFYVIVTYEDANNKRIQKWIATGLDVKGNKRRAEEVMQTKLEEFKKEFRYRQNPESDILFADFIKDWLERMKPHLQESSFGSYQFQVNSISNYFREKGTKLLDLKPIDIANYYQSLTKQGKSVQVLEHHHVNLRKCLQSAVKADLIPTNPADKIDRPRSPKHVAKFYDSKMMKSLFEKLKGNRFEYIYKITALYGLRRSEMMGLKWKNIDFNKNMLTLSHAMVQTRINGKSIIIQKERLKNQSSLRSLPLLPIVKEMLIEEKAKQEENKRNFGKFYATKDEELVCVDELGSKIKPDTVSGHFKGFLKNNRMPRITFHELRHSCASLLLSMGIPMKEIQAWLGHSTYQTTANIYSHLDASSKYNAATALVGIFGTNQDVEKQKQIKQDVITELDEQQKVESDNMSVEFRKYQEKLTKVSEPDLDIDEEIALLEQQLKEKKLARLKKKSETEM